VHEGKPSEPGAVTLVIGKDGLIGRAIGENLAICEYDVLRNPSYYAVSQFNFIRSELVVPIRHGERVLGALDAQDDHRDAFGEEDLFVMQTLSDQLAVAIVNSELHMAVERQAHADSLTGVYNHGYFLQCLNDELVHAQRTGQPLALIMLDIDYFKQYNDRYGHVIGDRVLQVIVQAIRENIKHEDLVGRWGGEEFGIALPNTSAPQGLIVAERIRRTLAAMEMRDNAGGPIEKPTISQGLASFPDHANSPEALVDRADRMLYLAKEHGRDQVVQYQMRMTG
jgi:diguanylate cyclase (GGDEF)-like protein